MVGVERLDPVRLPRVEVDRPGVALVPDAHAVDRAEQPPAPLLEDDVRRAGRARAHLPLRAPPVADEALPASVAREAAGRDELLGDSPPPLGEPPHLLRGERLLGRGADEVRARDRAVPRVEDRALEGAVEQLLGVRDEVLVEGVGERDEDDDRVVPLAPHAPDPLPRRGARPG